MSGLCCVLKKNYKCSEPCVSRPPGFCGHGVGHGVRCGPIQGGGEDVRGGELAFGDHVGQGFGGGVLHLLGDLHGPAGEGALEQAGEDQHVVDLVGEVGPARAHHSGPVRQGYVGHDLRHGVGHGQQDGVLGHALDHLTRHQAGAGDADEHIGPDQGVGQGAVLVFPVGPGGQGGVMGGQTSVALAEDAVLVAEDHVGKALVQQQLGGGAARGPDAVEDDLHVLLLLSDDL